MKIINLQIKGTGSFLPDYILTNAELETMVDTSDEWITDRTGIKERRICKENTVSEMAVGAAERALYSAQISACNIDLIIAATITPDFFTPSLSCIVQKEIGAENAFCFDINAACTGFVYALDIADCYVKTGRAKNILIVASEAISKITDYTDRNTCVLFGDGAGAVVATAGEGHGLIDSYIKAIGAMGDVLVSSTCKEDSFIKMNGKEVYKFAVSACSEAINALTSKNGITFGDLKYIVPHQANDRIVGAVAAKLGWDKEKFFMNVEKYGNTSSASIPICLDEMNKGGMLSHGDKIILVGFGAGLTYGGVLLEWL
ncbi:MAG: 3-oxoacyl-(acyl-carrier-protein) synthase 3 [Firmicutes bacterium ADurb.Bin193]|nr:MAG: 3-oxoacyl-(acyl-carrier-protein) synthase 3 [Firmicutes bacterium ADurb.Bin193]